MTDQPTGDFDGCNSECRKAGKHSLRWGGCEHATPPEPTVSMSVVYTDPADGYPAIGFDTYTVPQLAELIEPALNATALRAWRKPSEVATEVAQAIVHRHDDEPAPAVPVSSPPPDQTALSDRIAEALDSLKGTVHHLAPKTQQAVQEALMTALAAAPSPDQALAERIAAAAIRLGHPRWDADDLADAVLAELRTVPAVPVSSPPPDQTALRDRIVAAIWERQNPGRRWADCEYRWRADAEADAAAVLAVLPPPADWAAVLREEAALIRAHCPDHLDSNSAEGSWINCHCDVADDMERRAAEAQQPDTETQPEWARPETEEEKLAKARRMAKALSAPPVAPPEWASTREWPNRHKRRGDRRVHATAPFESGVTRQFWTACEKPIGKGGYPLSHMAVDCRDCKRAITAVPVQPAADGESPPVHKGGNADDCPACIADGLDTIGSPYECPGPEHP